MSPSQEEQLRAHVRALVDEAGSIDAARDKDAYTQDAWRELCRHFGIEGKPKKARNLEEALEALRRRVESDA